MLENFGNISKMDKKLDKGEVQEDVTPSTPRGASSEGRRGMKRRSSMRTPRRRITYNVNMEDVEMEEEEEEEWSPSKDGSSPEPGVKMKRRSKSVSMPVVTPGKSNGTSPEEEVVENDSGAVNVAEVERKRLYDAHLERVATALKKLETEWNEKIVSQTQQFLEDAEQLLRNPAQASTAPVAFVPSGLSTEEDKATFDMIEAEVIKTTSLVARISAFKCSNVRIAFQTICKQLDSPSSTTPRALRKDLDSRFGGSTPTEILAVIVEKAEYFSKNVLLQLLQLLSTADLPMLLIVGVSHCMGNFSRFIPSTNCSTTFVYSEFQTVSTTQRLHQLLYKILDADLGPFTLGGDIVKYLSHYFVSQHASVARLFQAYRLCLLEHYRKPEAILCRIPSTSSTKDNSSADELFAKAAEMEGIPSGKILAKASNESWTSVIHWNFVLRIISFVEASLQSRSSIDTFKDLYISCSRGSFFEPSTEGDFESPYNRFLNEIRKLSKSGLTRVISRLVWDLGLEECPDDPSQGLVHQKSDLYIARTKVPDIIDSLERIKDDLNRLDEKEKENKPVENMTPKSRLKFKKGIRREELQKMLKENITTDSTSKPVYELRDSFIQFIDSVVKAHLKPLSSLLKGVHYKAFVFDDLATLKSLFSPDPLALITNSLVNPSQILECKCCEDVSSTSNMPSLPDSSIIFKLLKEQTNKKVDLNSLFQAFLAILETEPEETNRTRRVSVKLKKLDKNSCLLRFRQSLAELQFTGVLKRSKTNPDEITKLIW